MSAKIFSASLAVGLASMSCGAALQFGVGVGLLVGGALVIGLTLVVLRVAGKR